jgi:transposase InsO family protein
MGLRRAVVEVEVEGLNVSAFCREHGISRWLFYELRRRYRSEGEAGLEPRSRAPKTVANRIPETIEDVICELRKRLADDGMDNGPATIRVHLQRQVEGVVIPSEATIWRVLSRRGFITANPSKAPKHAYRRFTADRVNECWQIDDTAWALGDDTVIKIINIVDDCSRVLISSRAYPQATSQAAFETFCAGAERWDWPARFLSDNAKAYRNGLADTLRPLGIASGHSRPYHPQTCGKVERFHQTLKKHLSAHPTAATIDQLQHQLDRFADTYNHHRPHRSLDRQTPAHVHATTPRSGPADRALHTPTKVHRVTVTGGACHINNKLYAITIGNAYEHQTATVIITGTNCHVFVAGRLIRELTLDPTRRYQPLHNRPGRPTTVSEDPRHP